MSSTTSQPVAIVTGAASGIGLAVSKHLLSENYRVVLADVNATDGNRLADELGSGTIFHRTDVSVYADQAALFARALEWGGRLDLLAANAGIDDRQSLYDEPETDADGVPKELNLKTLRVDLDSVFQGIWLFKYYSRRNRTGDSGGGQIIITSSTAGIYAFETNPQYAAAKHALVGLTRSCAPPLLSQNIRVNCICPAFVPTNLCPPHLRAVFPKQHTTPMSTVIKAVDLLMNHTDKDDGTGDKTGDKTGKDDKDSKTGKVMMGKDDETGDKKTGKVMTGQVLELSLDQIYFREQPDWANESQRWLMRDSVSFWREAHGVNYTVTTEGDGNGGGSGGDGVGTNGTGGEWW